MSGTNRNSSNRADEKTNRGKPRLVMPLTLKQLDSSSFVITPGPKLASDRTSSKDPEFTKSKANDSKPSQVKPCNNKRKSSCAQESTNRAGPGCAEHTASSKGPVYARPLTKVGKSIQEESKRKSGNSGQAGLRSSREESNSTAASANNAKSKHAIPCESTGESVLHRLDAGDSRPKQDIPRARSADSK